MKITFYRGHFAEVDGGANHLITYAMQLKAMGHTPTVLLGTASSRDTQYFNQLRSAGIQVSCLGRSPLYNILRALRKATALANKFFNRGAEAIGWQQIAYGTALYSFKRERPDLLHIIDSWSTDTLPAVICAAHRVGIPVLYQEIASPPPHLDEGGHNSLSQLFQKCAEIVALSPHHAQLCQEGFPYTGHIRVLPLAIEDPFSEDKESEPLLSDVVFGFAARMEHQKGPIVLLDAFKEALCLFPSATLRMAGSGPVAQEVQERATSLGISANCEFTGPYRGLQEKTAFMRAITVFLLPSFAEGTPNSIIEAMSHGLPIIASDVGGIPDIVTPDVGILVPPGDIEALAKALMQLAADESLRKRMGLAARRRYEQLFSPRAVMPVVMETYERVINQKIVKRDVHSAREGIHPWTNSPVDL